MKHIRLLVKGVVVTVPLLGNCSLSNPSYTGVNIRTEFQKYRGGEVVQVTLMNNAGEALFVNSCQGRLEVLISGSWTAVQPAPPRFCKDILGAFRPGESRQEEFELPSALTTGTYRYTFSVYSADGSTLRSRSGGASNTFMVEPRVEHTGR